MDRPPFTAEQLTWLRANFPPGPAMRVLGDITPTTDAQQVGAYAVLTAEQRAKVDADNAKAAAQAQVDAATAQVTSATQVAQQAVTAAAGTDVDASTLEQVVAAVSPLIDASSA